MAEEVAHVTAPIVAANALDDLWAPLASRDALMAGYRGTDWQALDIAPARNGLGPIGHMGYFRRSSEPLWRAVIDYFDAHVRSPQTA